MQQSELHQTSLSVCSHLNYNPMTPALPSGSCQFTIQINRLILSEKGMENLRVIGYTFDLMDEA